MILHMRAQQPAKLQGGSHPTPCRRGPLYPYFFLAALCGILALATPSLAADKSAVDYAKDLESADNKVRREAAYQLSRMGQEARVALPQLIKALDDGQQQVWFGAVTALAHLGAEAEPAIPALMKELEDWRPYRRDRQGEQDLYRTADALGSIGPPALPAVSNGLASTEWYVRAGCAKAIGFMGPSASSVIPALVRNLGDDRDEVREAVAEALGRLGPEAVPPLVQSLQAGTPLAARQGAADALGRIGRGADAALPALRGTVDADPDETVRIAALKAIARIDRNPASVVPVLMDAWHHGSRGIQDTAAGALLLVRPIGSAVIPFLLPDLGSTDGVVRDRAADLVAEFGADARPARDALILLIHATGDDASGAASAVRALAAIGPDAVPAILVELSGQDLGSLRPGDWRLEILRRLDATTVPALASALTNAFASVRFGALEGLAALGHAGYPAAPNILPLLSDREPRVRAGAWKAATACDADPATLMAKIDVALDDPSMEVRRAAIEGLSRLGRDARPAVPRIARSIGASDAGLRLEAIRALASLGPAASAAVADLTDRLPVADPNEQTEILTALGRIGPASAPSLTAMARLSGASLAEVRRAVVEAVGAVKDQGTNAMLIVARGLGDAVPGVRAAALTALAVVAPAAETTVVWSRSALDDSHVEVRSAAAQALSLLEERGRPAEARLFELLASDADRPAAVAALRAIHPESVPRLMTALGNDDWTVREMAADSLALLGTNGAPARAALQKAADDDARDEVKRAARRALRRVR